jgi:hypothetical protein
MPKVCVLGPIDDEAREALLKLLAEAGCEVVDEDVPAVEPDDEEDVEDPMAPEDDEPATADNGASAGDAEPQDEELGVIVLSPDCLADEALGRVMHRAAAQGRRVIGIWPPGTQDETLPRAFEDYGGDTVPWDAGSLRGALPRQNAKPEWLRPDAQPREERQTKRNKC